MRPTHRLALLVMVPGAVCLALFPPVNTALLALWILLPPLVGAVIGWVTRARVSMWALLGPAAVGVGMWLIGLAASHDDVEPGPIFGLTLYAYPVLVLSMATAGVAAGSSLRIARDTGRAQFGTFEIVCAVGVGCGLGLLSGVHPVYAVSGALVLALLWKTGAWWSGCLVPYGFGVWATFLSLGIRARRKDWLGWAAVYAGIVAMGWFVSGIGQQSQDAAVGASGAIVCVVGWGAGVLHAFRIRAEVRNELRGS